MIRREEWSRVVVDNNIKSNVNMNGKLLDLKVLKVSELKNWDRNPRGEVDLERLKEILMRRGQLMPLLVDGRDMVTVLGGNVNMRQQFPDDLKALDLIQALVEKFNLVIEPVPNQPNLLRIEPYDAWTDLGAQIDWTNKVDRDTKFQISHPAIIS